MTEQFLRRRIPAWVASLALVGVLATACGDDDESPDGGPGAAADPTTATSPSPSGMGDMGGMAMNDPDATPATELPDPTEGTFNLLDTAPPGSDAVAGSAWIAFGEDPGTTLTVELTGLEPGTEYVGHLHAQPCDQDNGGPHFAFDPDGAETPPDEVHIGFTADGSGNGTATVTNPLPADAATSVVLHPAGAMDNRLVCAGF